MQVTKKYRIVVLDDDQSRRDQFKSKIISNGHTAFCFEKAKICLDNLVSLDPNLILLGSPTEAQAYRFLNAISIIGTSTPVLIISPLTRIKQYVDINGEIGPIVIKPEFSPADIDAILAGDTGHRPHCPKADNLSIIIGNTVEIVQIKKRIPQLSQSGDRILIFGESGSGRELLARTIHFYNQANNSHFLKIYPGTLKQFITDHAFRENAVSSDGTGGRVDVRRENAETQTIYLSDIESFSPDLQGSLFYLLRMADHRQRRHTQGTIPKYRIICSAAFDLNRMVESGSFRKDLFFRLNVISCILPPLRHRIVDIPLLADYMADRYCFQANKTFIDISATTKDILARYHWPGNVHELEQVIEKIASSNNEHAVVAALQTNTSSGDTPYANRAFEDIYALADLKDIKNYMKDMTSVSLKDICREFIARAEKKLMSQALIQAKGNRKKAADMLDISYKSLLNKIKMYQLV